MKNKPIIILDLILYESDEDLNKKETTLEEVAERYIQENIAPYSENKYMYKKCFIEGAKWQMDKQEISYSEEDMKQFGDWCRNGLLNTEYGVEKLDEHLEQWKQFKNK